MPFRLLLSLLFSVFCGQNTVGILKSGRKTAGAFISHGFGDTGDIRLRTSQHDRRLLHTMLLHMGGNGGAIHGFECVFQRGGVHQKFAGQFLNGDPFGEMLHQIVMDIPDDGFL